MSNLPKPAHPRPDRLRSKWQNLNGEWEFSLNEKTYNRRITVPFSWTTKLSGIGEDVNGTGYYRRTVEFDPNPGEKPFLVIGAADYQTKVYINGVFLAEHLGGYAPIEVDLSSAWKAKNVLEIEVTDDGNEHHPRGKQGYGQIRGIWQTVYLESRPAVHLTYFAVKTMIDGTVLIDYELSDENATSTVTADFGGFRAEGKDYRLRLDIPNPHLWTTEDPFLYEGTINVTSGGLTDCVHTYFGIREVTSERLRPDGPMTLCLNRKPIYLNGVLDQAFNPLGHFTLPTDEDCEAEILRLKNIGLNIDRIHIKAEEPLKLYYADKHGVLVMQDFPCFFSEPDEEARSGFVRDLKELVRRDINHPAVFMWVAFNESWGISASFDHRETFLPRTESWAREVYHIIKAMDPTRPVEENSDCSDQHFGGDVNSFHFYINGYQKVKDYVAERAEKTVPGCTFNSLPGNRMWEVPMINSECGNVWGVEGGSGDSDLGWHYRYLMNEFRLHENIGGFVYTELRDMINEFNGYYRLDGTPKHFGMDHWFPGMTLKDLHAQDFVTTDCNPMTESKPGATVFVPLGVSSFTDENHGKKMRIAWELVRRNEDGTDAPMRRGIISARYETYGFHALSPLKIRLPKQPGLFILRLSLTTPEGTAVMRNFVLFDVPGVPCTMTEIPFSKLKSEGFDLTLTVQNGNKFNAFGSGNVNITLQNNDKKPISLLMEASAHPTHPQELNPNRQGIKPDCVNAHAEDPWDNPNTYSMTDDRMTPAVLTVSVNGKEIKKVTLPDAPADAGGALSWHYQKADNRFDEGGTYGYPVTVELSEASMQTLPETVTLTLHAEGGLSLYGRKSGSLPVGVYLKK